MKQILVLADQALNVTEQLSALTAGELGAYGIDTDSVWKPVAGSSDAPQIAFGVGKATGLPILTPMISTDIKRMDLTVSTYTAPVLPTVTVVADVTSFTAHKYDTLTIDVTYKDNVSPDKDVKELITVTGSYSTLATIHTAIAAAINAESKALTAATNGTGGATNVVLTGKRIGSIDLVFTFENGFDSGNTVAPTYTQTKVAGTEGVGTPEQVAAIVDSYAEELGFVTTMNRYDTNVTRQAVTGSKYTLITWTYVENKPTTPTRDTMYLENEIIFACDVTAATPSSLVDDIQEFINEIILNIAPPV